MYSSKSNTTQIENYEFNFNFMIILLDHLFMSYTYKNVIT